MISDTPTASRTAPEGSANLLGLVLTWLGGGVGALLIIPVLFYASLNTQMATADADDLGLFVCRTSECVGTAADQAFLGLAIAATIGILIMLAVWSSRRSLMAATALGGVATLAVLRFTLEIAAAGAYAEVIAIALVVVVGAGSFTAGCALRLWAGRQVKGDRPAGPGT